jgi:H+-translocating NAD(P) transhydrogenase subunit alpha
MFNLEPKLFVFLLSTFLGLEVIRRVSPLLHTPLMSLTNAISAIAVVAAIQVMAEGSAAAEGHSGFSTFLCTLAVIAATTNIVGGFWITDRMLKMFRRENSGRE